MPLSAIKSYVPLSLVMANDSLRDNGAPRGEPVINSPGREKNQGDQ